VPLDLRIDPLLEPWRSTLGRDFAAYRNHCQRVAAFCRALAPAGPEVEEKIAVAAAYHDLGIWTDRTFDYLPASRRLVRAYLGAIHRSAWAQELEAMIENHHKVTRYSGPRSWLVEPFRRADWIDISLGLCRSGVPAMTVREVRAHHPNAGFHRRLLVLSLWRLCGHPWDPLPMMRW
jgi:hypothetical protein